MNTCDPMGEGEELAKAIQTAAKTGDACPERAAQVMLVAAAELGVQFVVISGMTDDDFEGAMIEMSDEDRARLKVAIEAADKFIAEIDERGYELVGTAG